VRHDDTEKPGWLDGKGSGMVAITPSRVHPKKLEQRVGSCHPSEISSCGIGRDGFSSGGNKRFIIFFLPQNQVIALRQ